MSTWIQRLEPAATGVRVAVKDLIDVAGLVTTGASPSLADRGVTAAADAPCLSGVRAAGASIVGKANLHELAFGGTGINPWFGTPVNPLDPTRIPGGSSSGCAVAVADGEADVGIGTDTGGSVRTPSACCGTVGLKTTHGRIPLEGVHPLAPSLDTVGPMARDVRGVITGMGLLEPGFTAGPEAAPTIGRVRVAGTDPAIDAAIDAALRATGLEVVPVELPGHRAAVDAAVTILFGEAWRSDAELVLSGARLGDDIRARLEQGREVTQQQLAEARRVADGWRRELADAFRIAPVLAWPTLLHLPSRLDDPVPDTRTTNIPVNLAGVPSLALPVPLPGSHLPTSVQLVGPHGSEDLLCATGLVVEAASASLAR